jgi:hypothetical protein
MFDNTFLMRVLWKCACAAVVPLCLLVSVWKSFTPHPAEPSQPAIELPVEWQGRPVRPLALSDVERRFARQFPGSIARLTDGEHVIVLRTVLQPTRMLHPAADCYRGLGWRVQEVRLQVDAGNDLWRCFTARNGTQRQRVCEHIVDAQGQSFTDASSWYWAALLQQSQGPWRAYTVASPL